MIIRGHLGGAPKKEPGVSGNEYVKLRVAENYGPAGNRQPVWFDVNASISHLEADLLSSNAAVEIDGRLEAQAYISKQAILGEPVPTSWEGVIAALKRSGALKVNLKVLTRKVVPYQFKPRRPAATGSGSRGESVQDATVDQPPF